MPLHFDKPSAPAFTSDAATDVLSELLKATSIPAALLRIASHIE
jgi:hypothetical protein